MLIANLDKVENNNKTDVITFACAFDLVFAFLADLGKPFNAHSDEDVCKLIQCTQAALPFFSVS